MYAMVVDQSEDSEGTSVISPVTNSARGSGDDEFFQEVLRLSDEELLFCASSIIEEVIADTVKPSIDELIEEEEREMEAMLAR